MSRSRPTIRDQVFRDRFVVVKQIGQGAFSEVHLVRLKDSPSQEFALKSLVRSTNPKRAATELRILKELGGKNNVMRLFCSFRTLERTYFLLEYFPHVSFHDFYQDASVHEIRDYIKNLLIALQYIHQHGIIHRDVKPSNFLYDGQRKRYALIDFGLAEDMAPPAFVSQPNVSAPGSKSTAVKGKRKLEFDQDGHASSPKKRPPLLSQETAVRRSPRKLPSRSFLANTISGRGLRMSQEAQKGDPTADLFVKPTDGCQCFGRSNYCRICVARPLLKVNHAGTAGFRAPETLMNASPQYQTAAIDVWACGIVLLSLLSRRYPFMRPKLSCEAIACLTTLMGTEHVIAVAKALGVKLMYNHYCSRLDIRELCCLYRLKGDVDGLEGDQKGEQCLECVVNCRQAVTIHGKVFCLCHTGRADYRGPLFIRYVDKEFKGTGEKKVEDSGAVEIFDKAFDLLECLLEVNPLNRIGAVDALNHSWFID